MSEAKKENEAVWLRKLLGQSVVVLSLYECADGNKRLQITQVGGSNDDVNETAVDLMETFSALLNETVGNARDGLPNDQDAPH